MVRNHTTTTAPGPARHRLRNTDTAHDPQVYAGTGTTLKHGMHGTVRGTRVQYLERRSQRWWQRMSLVVALLVITSMVLVACGGDDDDDATATTPTGGSGTTTTAEDAPNLDDLSGEINIDGSSTVFPITQAVAEEFNAEASDVRIAVGVSGTGGGFEKFCAGETDISNASRHIKDEEAALCAENGVEFVELEIAIDGLSVVVNPNNDWASCLTMEQLGSIWMPGSTVSNWNQINDSFPDEDLKLYGPGTDSGTFDYFTGAVNGEEGASRADYTASEDDNVLVQGVGGDAGALGYFGYAYYIENEGAVKALGIDGGDGCIEPTAETVAAYEYPLSRPIFIYVARESLTRPEVSAFANFYLGNTGMSVVPEVGYVQIPAELQAEMQTRLSAFAAGEDVSAAPSPAASPDATEPAAATATVAGAASTATTAPAGTGALPAVEYADLSGEINIDGSSTVFPIAQAVAEEFNAQANDVRIAIGVSGTGGGFEKFCAGETDISNASRMIEDDEIALCESNGIEFVEVSVAFDGISLVVNTDNDWATCLTVDQVASIWAPESTISNWNQVDPSFPDEEMKLFGPGTDSGTFDYFTAEINGEEGASRADYTASEDDNVLVQGVAGETGGMGYFGYAYYVENQDSLQVVGIDSGTGCISPSPETIADGSYAPLSRPVFIYVSTEALTRPEVAGFITFFLSEDGLATIPEVGYINLDEATLEASIAAVAAVLP